MSTHTTAVSNKPLVDAHKNTPQGLKFYASLDEMRVNRTLVPYLHAVVRAWQDLDLDGVLCIDGRPTLYLATRKKQLSADDAADLHRRFWNQGLATVLVVADSAKIRVYSGLAKPTGPSAEAAKSNSLVETLALADYTMNLNSFMLCLATGSYYRLHSEHFDFEATVDAYLLNNLRKLRDGLLSSSNITAEVAHTFLARVLFVCYLIDRGIIDLGDIEECQCGRGTKLGDMLGALKTVEEKQRALCSLFGKLKDDFNGSMFDPATLAECRQLNRASLDDLTFFLQGHELGTGQYTLDFWAYDFRLIPIETISSVYEDFLKKEDEPNKRTKGAYYTPRFLAETIVDMALSEDESLEGRRFLDPACGSGIFLVTLFNRLATMWESEHPTLALNYDRKADALKGILRDQLCGVDVNLTACRIACFSLYLAFLDRFDPPDVRGYVQRKGKLPSILLHRDSNNDKPPAFPVIREDDFLDSTHPLPVGFDYVLGNPPWQDRGSSKGKHHLFASKIPMHLAKGGTACVLLPSKTFLNDKTNKFQSEWLRAVTVEEVVQLADYRKILFEEARCPCMIVRFRALPPNVANAMIEYSVPKVTHIDRRNGVIPVAPADRKMIPLRQLLAAAEQGMAPQVWKEHLWGTPFDIKLLALLQQMPKLGDIAGEPGEGKQWMKGEGFQPETKSTTNPTPRPWGASKLFLEARSRFPALFVLPDDCMPIADLFPSLHRARDPRIYKAPLVLVSQGIGKGGSPKVAFCDSDVVFRDSLQVINGPAEDTDLLIFLSVYLRSKLAKYFLFHVAVNWGTERDKMLLKELLLLPFPLPGSEYVPEGALKIVSAVSRRVQELRCKLEASRPDVDNVLAYQHWLDGRNQAVDSLQGELETLVFMYFGLIEQEIVLIEDTVDVVIPSATPDNIAAELRTRAPVHQNRIERYAQGLVSYASILSSTLNNWAKEHGARVRVSITGGIHSATDMVCVKVALTHKEHAFTQESPSEEALQYVINLATLGTRRGVLDYLRGVIFIEGSCIYIFKPSALIGWTQTAALNDAAEIYANIVAARSEVPEAKV